MIDPSKLLARNAYQLNSISDRKLPINTND